MGSQGRMLESDLNIYRKRKLPIKQDRKDDKMYDPLLRQRKDKYHTHTHRWAKLTSGLLMQEARHFGTRLDEFSVPAGRNRFYPPSPRNPLA